MDKEVIVAENGIPPVGPYSPGIKIGNWLFISGQGPLDPETKKMPDEFKDQVKAVMENIKGIVEAAGGTMDNLVKTTVFLKDMNKFNKMNRVYKKYFSTALHIYWKNDNQKQNSNKDRSIVLLIKTTAVSFILRSPSS